MKLTIGKKLGLGFGSVIALMAASAAAAYVQIAGMNTSAETVAREAFPTVRACDQMLAGINHSLAALRGYLLFGNDPEQADRFRQERRQGWQTIETARQRLSRFADNSTEEQTRENFNVVESSLQTLRATQKNVETTAHSAGGGDTEPYADPSWKRAIDQMESQAVPEAIAVRDALEELRQAAEGQAKQARTDLDAAGAAAGRTLITGTLAAIVIGSVVALVISRRLVSAIQGLLDGVQTVSRGDLAGETIRLHSGDELGELASGFNSMVASLRDLLAETSTMTGEVASSSSQIATASQQQVASLNQTATSLNQITTTAEEFKTTMQEFADRAQAVQEATDETAKQSGEGRALTQDSATRIEQVRTNAVAAGESALNLSDQMQRIGEITATVNEIAEQTKLLALNASIEAARAGEEGRGFAVVATQVRELANQSKEAAGRIESLISETQKSVREVVEKIDEGGRLSEDSVQIVRRVTSAFEEIAEAIERTRDAVRQINAGAREQEQGITELVNSITEIDSSSKESLTAAQQTQQSIVAIDQRIQTLNASIARFKT